MPRGNFSASLRGLQLRPWQVWHEPKSAASKKPVVLHSLVMGLPEKTGGRRRLTPETRISSSPPTWPHGQATARTEHACGGSSSASSETGSSRFRPWSQVWLAQSQTCTIFVPWWRSEPTPKLFRICCVGQTLNPAQGLRALAHGEAHGGSGKDDRSHKSERGNCSTAHSLTVGYRPWVISPDSSSLDFRISLWNDGGQGRS